MLSQRIEFEQDRVIAIGSTPSSTALSADDQMLMRQYGISLTALGRFEFGSFAYSTLPLAVAQARQAERRTLS